MTLAPETPTSVLAQAPPDRPSLGLEQALNQVRAIIFGDNQLDQTEMRLLRAFFQEVAVRAQTGGVGQGGTPPSDVAAGEPPPSPMEMNQNTQDYGTAEGANPEEEDSY